MPIGARTSRCDRFEKIYRRREIRNPARQPAWSQVGYPFFRAAMRPVKARCRATRCRTGKRTRHRHDLCRRVIRRIEGQFLEPIRDGFDLRPGIRPFAASRRRNWKTVAFVKNTHSGGHALCRRSQDQVLGTAEDCPHHISANGCEGKTVHSLVLALGCKPGHTLLCAHPYNAVPRRANGRAPRAQWVCGRQFFKARNVIGRLTDQLIALRRQPGKFRNGENGETTVRGVAHFLT